MSHPETERYDGDGAAALSRILEHRHSLTFLSGPRTADVFRSEQPRLLLGAAPDNDIQVEDSTVSRRHCEISFRAGEYRIRDLGSTNGTRVDGVRIVEALLDPGSVIQLGSTELRFDAEHRWAEVAPSQTDHLGEMWGRSPVMRQLFGVLERIAATELTCLLLGETGTGKDLAARALHGASARANGPFVVVDCGALNEHLVEAELFGHERGAFTGADRDRKGCFERAHGGTVFLDEIGDLPHELQPKLLRVLERREVRPLGGGEPVAVNVRVVAATHRDLEAMVQAGTFREDLYFRIAEIVVSVPPLRDRTEDIAVLAARILESFPGSTHSSLLAEDAVAYLAAQPWPGNVRELRNVLRRAAALANGTVLDRAALIAAVSPSTSGGGGAPLGGQVAVELEAHLPLKDARARWLASLERRYLEHVCAMHGPDVGAAATHIGVHRKSFFRLRRQVGIEPE